MRGLRPVLVPAHEELSAPLLMVLFRLELRADDVVSCALAFGVRRLQRWAIPHPNHVAVERGVRAVAGRQRHCHRGGSDLGHGEGPPTQ